MEQIKGKVMKIDYKDKVARIKVYDEQHKVIIWLSCFERKIIDALNTKDTFIFEAESKGNFLNISKIHLCEEKEKPLPQIPIQKYSDLDRMAFGNCLNCASRVCSHLNPLHENTIKIIFNMAEKLFNEGKKRGRF